MSLCPIKLDPRAPSYLFGLSRLTKNNPCFTHDFLPPKKIWTTWPVESPYCSWGCFAVVLPWRFMVGTTWWTHGPPTFQVNCADWIFPYEKDPIFWRPGKTTAVFIPQKKKNASTEQWICTKKTWLFPKHRRKRLTIVPRSRKTPWSEVAPQYWEKGKHNICTP